jgi:hypothetical protein
MPGGRGLFDSRLQVTQPTQRADNPPTDLLEDLGNVRIVGRLDLHKAWLAARPGAIEVDSRKKNHMEMEVQIHGATGRSQLS